MNTGFFNFFTKENNTNTAQKPINDMVLQVSKSRCPQNHRCPAIRVCPVEAITQKGYAAPVVDMDKCIKCGKCVKFCPMRALSLQ